MAVNRITYTLIIIMTVTFVFLSEHRAAYAALYAALLFPAVSFAVLLAVKGYIHISGRLVNNPVNKGEAARYTLKIKNSGYISGFKAKAVFGKKIRQTAKISKPGIIYLPARGTAEKVYNFVYDYCGNFDVCADYIVIYDFLCLFKIKIKTKDILFLTVLPDINNLEFLPDTVLAQASLGETGGLAAEDYSDLPDLKKYTPTDGYKRIHWRLSAKRGELISKNYNAAEKSAVSVIINNTRFPEKTKYTSGLRCAESLIEAAVSVIFNCNVSGLPVSLDYIGGTGGEPLLEFYDLYTAAARIRFNKTGDFNGFLAEMVEMRRDSGSIFIFT
ncbi:MAG: DUF58 domain-containing protein, partial [Oscillospiraceae bacterium]|nr:DUF58 domain-containing protein [Oscillospiraceae bacterium]